MTFPELDKKFDKVIKDLTDNYNGQVMAMLAASAKTAIFERIIKSGTDAKGNKFPPYSTKTTLIGSSSFAVRKDAADKIFGSKQKRAKLDWRKVGVGTDKMRSLALLPGGYAKIRQLQGRQTAFVDFSMTNRMWTDIQVISNQSDHQRGIAIIGAKQESEKKKLAGNTKRKGDILDLSGTEIDQLKRSYGLGALQVFKNNGL